MKTKVVILYGGPSSEHEVSISSAKNILENINRELFEVIEVYINKEGLFDIAGNLYQVQDALKKIKNMSDIVYPVLHGTFGEDGKLQALLEKENIPFVGSGSLSSQIAIDKNKTNELFAKHNLNIPQSQVVSKENSEIKINFPIIVKPISEGSSVGLYKIESEEKYKNMLIEIFSVYPEMLAQEYISGREFTCGVLEIDNQNIALPVSEIILLKSTLFDYKTKYTAGECTEVTPAQIDLELQKQIQNIALLCHEVLNCKSISITDVMMSDSGNIYILETNTLPGMTKTSFIPQQALVHGLSMRDVITILLNSAKV